MSSILKMAMEQVLDNKKTLDEAIAEMEKGVQRELERLKKKE